MRAAVCREFGQPLVIEEITLAAPGPGEIRVKVAACAICHSDIFYAQGAWGGTWPAVFGHEAAGVVEEVGAGVRHLAVGDHVVVTLIRFCGQCAACAEGSQVFCEAVFPLDARSPLSRAGESIVHGLRTGAFAEYVVVEASQAVAIDLPASVSHTLRPPRSSSRRPSAASRLATCWLTAPWVRKSDSAARDMLCCRATARKVRSCSSEKASRATAIH